MTPGQEREAASQPDGVSVPGAINNAAPHHPVELLNVDGHGIGSVTLPVEQQSSAPGIAHEQGTHETGDTSLIYLARAITQKLNEYDEENRPQAAQQQQDDDNNKRQDMGSEFSTRTPPLPYAAAIFGVGDDLKDNKQDSD